MGKQVQFIKVLTIIGRWRLARLGRGLADDTYRSREETEGNTRTTTTNLTALQPFIHKPTAEQTTQGQLVRSSQGEGPCSGPPRQSNLQPFSYQLTNSTSCTTAAQSIRLTTLNKHQ